MKTAKLLFVIPLILFLAGAVFGSVPTKISYEGRLVDSSGNAITTAKTVSFTIFDASSAGTAIWGPESQSVTPDSQGVFSVLLGNTTAITPAVFNSAARFLEITVGGETLSPRTQLVSVGYSFKSASAQGVEDGSITNSSIANATITNAKVASGQFVTKVLAGSGVGVSGDGTGQVTLTATGTGGGTVSQVNTGTGLTGGPITTTGTISIDSTVATLTGTQTLTNKTISDSNNTITLTAATIPNLDASKITTGTLATARLGSGTASSTTFLRGDQTWATPGGSGTVTQVNSGTGLTGGPITGTGTLSIDATVATLTGSQTLTNKTISDSSNTLTLTATTIPNLDASKITTGTFAVARGGTSQSTYATGDLLYASGTNTLAKLPIGLAGQVLKSTAGIPSWEAAGGTGTVTQVNTGAGLTGGPITTVRAISIDATVATLNGTQTLTNKTISGASNTLTNISDTSLNTISTAGKVSGNAITSGTIGGSTNVNTTGTITAAAFSFAGGGTVVDTNSAQTLLNKTFTGTTTMGAVTATSFSGNGSALTNLDAGNITSGVLAIARGGTGLSTYTTGDILYASGTNTLAKLPIGLAGQVLKSTAGIPSWEAVGGTGTVTQVNTGTGLTGGPITAVGTISIDATVATLSGGQTLTNKTISGASNTLTNISDTSLNTISTAGKVSGGAITSGTIGGSTNVNTTGTITAAAFSFAGGGTVVDTNSAQTLLNKTFTGTTTMGAVTATSFSGNGSALTNLDAGNITSGVLAIARGGTNANAFTASQIVRMNAGGTALESSGKTVPTGNIVGDTDTQILTNKTLDSTNSITGEAIKTGSISATVLNNSGLVTLTGAQTLSNKTFTGTTTMGAVTATSFSGDGSALTSLNAGNISSGTLAIARGGTNATSFTASQLVRMNAGGTALESSGKTVPTGNIVGDTDTQTLTNKTISGASNTLTNISDTSLNTISTAGKVSGNAITSGTIGGSTGINTTGTITAAAFVTTSGASLVDTTSAQTISGKTFTGTTTMGAVTATSFSGSGASLTSLNAGNISSGTLGATNGGTGLASYATGDTLYASATNTLSKLTIGAAGQHMVVRSGIPSWEAATSGTVTQVNTGTGLTGGPITATGTISIDATVATLAGTQTLTNKTLTAPVISTIVNTGTLTLPTATDTLVGRATADTLSNKTFTGTTTMAAVKATSFYTPRFSATTSIDWNNGNTQSLTLANGVNVLTFANGQDGGKYVLILKQPASGAAGTVTWPAAARWPGGAAVTLTATNAKTDYIGFIFNGVDSKYDGVAFTPNF